MSQMVDPIIGLRALQDALDNNLVEMSPCELTSEIEVHFDRPNGEYRYSYAKIQNGIVQALVQFVVNEPLNGLPCFGIGYAVIEERRQKQLGTLVVSKSIDEMVNGLSKNGLSRFYFEAIIGRNNFASQHLAAKLISNDPRECVDSYSGEDAFAYTRLIEP